MTAPRNRRLSPSMIVALLALLVATTGTATATTAALINGKQIANGTLTGADIKDKSIGAKKLVGNFRGAPGPIGPPGPTGSAGPPGPAPDTTQFYKKTETDARYLRGTVTVVATNAVANNSFAGATATCPAGHHVVGGGVSPANVLTMYVTGSFPLVNGGDPILLADGQYAASGAWRGFVRNESGGVANFKVVAVCAPLG